MLVHPPAVLQAPCTPSARQQRIEPTLLRRWWAEPACLALSYKVCLYRACVYANVYWAEASLMVCNAVFCSFILQLFALQKLHCGNWPQAAYGRKGNLPVCVGPFHISVLHAPCFC